MKIEISGRETFFWSEETKQKLQNVKIFPTDIKYGHPNLCEDKKILHTKDKNDIYYYTTFIKLNKTYVMLNLFSLDKKLWYINILGKKTEITKKIKYVDTVQHNIYEENWYSQLVEILDEINIVANVIKEFCERIWEKSK